jgi:hypothetical protein
MVPAILEQVGRELEALEVPKSPSSADDLKPVHDAQAAVELLLLCAWRDLVVAEVRDQQYEVDRVRKMKGGRTKRAAKRGDLEVVGTYPGDSFTAVQPVRPPRRKDATSRGSCMRSARSVVASQRDRCEAPRPTRRQGDWDSARTTPNRCPPSRPMLLLSHG